MATENIEGTATDPNGNPLQDAVIALFLTNKNASDGDQNTVQYTRTDSNGFYSIDDHPNADGTSQEWHVAGYYQDGTGEFNALSKPSVEASVGSAIPDSAIAYYDFRDNDGTLPINDQSGTGNDLTQGSFSGVTGDINGQQAGRFDGSQIVFDTLQSTYSPPFYLYQVIKLKDANSGGWFGLDDNDDRVQTFSNQIRLRGGSFPSIDDQYTDGGNYITSIEINSSGTFSWRVYESGVGTRTYSDSASGFDVSKLILADIDSGGNITLNCSIGQLEIHDTEPSEGFVGRETAIKNDWLL